MTRRRLLVAALAVAALPAVVGAPAAALAPDAVGWWRDTSLASTVVAPPEVPDGGLYVAGQVTGPEAVAALRFSATDGVTVESLTLELASTTGDVALVACPAGASWSPEDGGDWSHRPTADCGDGGRLRALGQLSDDGRRVTFPLSTAMVRAGLDLVIEPGLDAETGQPAMFRAVFDRPGDGALAATAVAGVGQVAEPAAVAAADDAAPTAALVVTPPPAVAPVAATPPAAVAAAGGESPAALTDFVVGAPVTAFGPRPTLSPAKRLAAIALALSMVVLLVWVNRAPALARVVAFAARHGGDEPAERVGGVGRFARTRAGPVPPL